MNHRFLSLFRSAIIVIFPTTLMLVFNFSLGWSASVSSVIVTKPDNILSSGTTRFDSNSLSIRPYKSVIPIKAISVSSRATITKAISVTVLRNANLRSGPGTTYQIVGNAKMGQQIDIVACNPGCTWYQLSGAAWIASFLVSDVTEQLPEVSTVYTLSSTLTNSTTLSALVPFSITIMTYNVLFGSGVDRQWDEEYIKTYYPYLQGKNRLKDLLVEIEQRKPTILGIQEAAGWDKGNPSVIQQVAERLDMNYSLVNTPSELDIVLLTKYEIVDVENLSVQIGNVGAMKATLLTPEEHKIHVFIVHLDPFSQTVRLREVDTLVEQMQPYLNQTTFLLGDMNFKPHTEERKKLEQAELQLVNSKSGGFLYTEGIDQIWISESVKWRKKIPMIPKPVEKGSELRVSDHNPVVAEITIFQ